MASCCTKAMNDTAIGENYYSTQDFSRRSKVKLVEGTPTAFSLHCCWIQGCTILILVALIKKSTELISRGWYVCLVCEAYGIKT